MSNLFSENIVRALICIWTLPTNTQGVFYLLIISSVSSSSCDERSIQTRTQMTCLHATTSSVGLSHLQGGRKLSKQDHVSNSSSFDCPWTRESPEHVFEVFQQIQSFRGKNATPGALAQQTRTIQSSTKGAACRSICTHRQAMSSTPSNIIGNWLVLVKAGFQQLYFRSAPTW